MTTVDLSWLISPSSVFVKRDVSAPPLPVAQKFIEYDIAMNLCQWTSHNVCSCLILLWKTTPCSLPGKTTFKTTTGIG
uniref:Uncharacterized protein n=1 Tax=Romanomermis culicivorax TaxID=13658 RepID=A0A915LB30_ROMCU